MNSVNAYMPGSGLRPASTIGRIQGGIAGGMRYPHPFFDIAHTYLPVTMKQLFRWCRHFFLLEPILHIAIMRLSEYPITDVIIDNESEDIAARWSSFIKDDLRFRAFQIEVGIDYHTYGNSFTTISYPFIKYLKCPACEGQWPAEKVRAYYRFVNYDFKLNCPRCGENVTATPTDYPIRNPKGIRLLRLNPEDIDIEFNEVTGNSTYFYQIPGPIRSDVLMGKKHIIEDTPQLYIQAMRSNMSIVIDPQNLFHMRRPTLASQDRGWGIPLLLPLLKDTFQLQIMKKAMETVLLEHLLPLRVMFPQMGSGSSDPFTTINLQTWKAHVQAEIGRWRMDPAYIPVLPLPIGNQTLGGDGKALLMTAEIQQKYEGLLAGMGVPRELVFGGLGYSGANVSLRIQENSSIGYMTDHNAMLRWIIRNVSSYLRWPSVSGRFKPFKMADDIQRQALNLQLNERGKLSDTTLLAGLDYSQKEENKIMIRETADRMEATRTQQLAQARLQGEQQLVIAQYQVRAQQAQNKAMQSGQAPGEPGGPDTMGAGTAGGQVTGEMPGQPAPQSPNPNVQQGAAPDQNQAAPPNQEALAFAQAQQIANLPPDQQQQQIQSLMTVNPGLGQMVLSMLQAMGGAGNPAPPSALNMEGGTAENPVDMRPLPVQRPPRRTNSAM